MILDEIVKSAEDLLEVATIPDYPQALNGLQLANNGVVTKIGAAVDASLPVFEKAIAEGVDLLVVHHGLFWQGAQKITGSHYRKLKLAFDHNLAVFSVHIPLDVHPGLGNNVLLAEAIGMKGARPFFPWKGISLGLKGDSSQKTLLELKQALEGAVKGPVLMRGEPSSACGAVGIITGGAGSEVAAIKEAGIDTFITGEGPHWSHPLAEELDLNVLYAGHYATETFGVKALSRHLADLANVEVTFIHHPTGL